MYIRDILWKYKIEGRVWVQGNWGGFGRNSGPYACQMMFVWNCRIVVISLNTQIAKFCSNSKSWAWKCLVYRTPVWGHGWSPACVWSFIFSGKYERKLPRGLVWSVASRGTGWVCRIRRVVHWGLHPGVPGWGPIERCENTVVDLLQFLAVDRVIVV